MSATDPNAPPATPTPTPTPDEELPQWVKDMMEQYGFSLSPEQGMAFANMATNAATQLAAGQMQYQLDFLKQKQQELDLSAKQMELAEKQFAFQSGPYWDAMSGEWFEFEKQKQQDAFDLSKLNLKTQKGLSTEELARSKNMTLSTMYQTEAAKATAEAQKWQAMAALGGSEAVKQSQATPRDLLWNGG